MPDTTSAIGFYGYGLGAAAYLALAVLLFAGWRQRLLGALFIAACLATAVWAGIVAYGYGAGAEIEGWDAALDHLRQGLWIGLLWALLHPEPTVSGAVRTRRLVPRTGLLLVLWLGLGAVELQPHLFGFQARLLAHLVLVTVGLVFIENLLRRTPEDTRWSLKFLCIGLGGVFAYDLFLTAEKFLFQGTDPALEAARGAVLALVAPLLGISARRIRNWDSGLTISRSTAFYSGVLTASGLYLFLMAVAAFFVGRLGGEAGVAFQAIFLFGTMALLAVLLTSGSIRAHLKNFIGKHFFHYKYDYRQEWLRFTGTLSQADPGMRLETRVVRAIADVLDSPAGAMWLRQDEQFALASAWNLTAVSLSAAESNPLVRFLETTQSVIDIPELSGDPGKYDGLVLPGPLERIDRAWTIIPLMHHETLVGIVLLTRPRAPRDLDWEDIDLLKALGRHAASYIAEQEAGRALAEVREFEKLNRRFAFALHDMKNLISRLSLLSSNFAKHGENREFRNDMVATLITATDQMKRLMRRLQGDQPVASAAPPVMLRPMLEDLVALEATRASMDCESQSANLAVFADHDRLSAVFAHLFENATEAIGEGGRVRLHLHQHDRSAVVEFIDNGCGMDEVFIEKELFHPFRSTKTGGFGLGAYQCREYVRELGGDLEIISSPGSGTTVRVILPAADLQAGEDRSQAGEDRSQAVTG